MRSFLEELSTTGDLHRVRRGISVRYELAAVARRLDGTPVLFEKVKESKDYRVASGVCSSRSALAQSLNMSADRILDKILEGIDNPKQFKVAKSGPCQEVVEEDVDLRRIPILTHCEKDGGPYITSGVVIARDDEYGYNSSFHRMMLLGRDRLAIRVLPRHLDEFIRRGDREVGIAIGNHPAFLFASAVSCEIGKSELAIANSLKEMSFVGCTTNESLVPADCELVLEGEITDELADEGPFPDIMGTYDIVRKQRVLKVNRVTHRKNPVYHAIIPGGSEHMFLMGTPREATIFREVRRVCTCLDARLTKGGSSWLHAVIKIRKRSEDDPGNALGAAFKGHPSLKHAVVVDDDIDISNPHAVEWAIATRAQMDRSMVVRPGELGSSLDPSADQVTRRTCKAGIDATMPLTASKELFLKARIPGEDQINPDDYLK